MDRVVNIKSSSSSTSEPHFNHHTHEYKKLSHLIILRYIDLFIPCEICGTTITLRERCPHGTLICQDHHTTSFEYLGHTDINDRYTTYSQDKITQNKIHIKKAKKCDICKSHKKETKDSCCYLSSVAPIYNNSYYPYRTEDNSFKTLTYKKKLIQHCCRHNGKVIINHFNQETKPHTHRKIQYVQDDQKFYFKDQLTKCSICDSFYNKQNNIKNMTLNLNNSCSLEVCETCIETALLGSDFFQIETKTYTYIPFTQHKYIDVVEILKQITKKNMRSIISIDLRSKKLIEFINLIIAHRYDKTYREQFSVTKSYTKRESEYMNNTYTMLYHLFHRDHNHKNNEHNED